MASASIAQSVNRQSVGAALQQARKECGQHLRWLNALNHAALNLEVCPWQFDGDVLVTASASDGSSRYTVDVHGCGCRAAQKGSVHQNGNVVPIPTPIMRRGVGAREDEFGQVVPSGERAVLLNPRPVIPEAILSIRSHIWSHDTRL